MRTGVLPRQARKEGGNHSFAGGDKVVGTVTVILEDGLLSTPLESTDVTEYVYVRPASTVLSVYCVPRTGLMVNLTGPLGGEARYTLYPSTGDMLAVQPTVTEWGLSDAFWSYQLCIVPHPAKSESAAREYRPKPRRRGREWIV